MEIELASFSVPWREGDFRELIARDGAVFLCARCKRALPCYDEASGAFSTVAEGSVAGYAGMYYVSAGLSDDGMTVYEGIADIVNVAVRPLLRRRGVGRLLLDALRSESESLALGILTLEVRRSNAAARGLYESLGFAEVGTRRNYYTKPREDAILMDLRLGRI